MSLEELRARIDAIDDQIAALLAKRAEVVKKVAAFKHRHAIPIHLPDRERAIIERLQARNAGVLSAAAIERIYRAIFEEMRHLEGESMDHGASRE